MSESKRTLPPIASYHQESPHLALCLLRLWQTSDSSPGLVTTLSRPSLGLLGLLGLRPPCGYTSLCVSLGMHLSQMPVCEGPTVTDPSFLGGKDSEQADSPNALPALHRRRVRGC